MGGETKWTPGPWLADRNGTVWANGDGINDGFCIVSHVFAGRARPETQEQLQATQDEALANAHLIAAAPDLYEACQTAMEAVRVNREGGTYPDFDEWERNARAALTPEQQSRFRADDARFDAAIAKARDAEDRARAWIIEREKAQ